MRSALQIRKSVNISRITKLTQGSNSLDAYLCEAQDLKCEARTVAVTAQMEQLCTQIVTGLREDIRRTIRDAVLSIYEKNLKSESNADDIQTVLNLIVNRIRARGAQLFPQHMFSTSVPGEAAAFAVPQPGPDPSPTHSSPLPPKAPQNGPDHSKKKCYYCYNINEGHIKRDCALYRRDLESGGMPGSRQHVKFTRHQHQPSGRHVSAKTLQDQFTLGAYHPNGLFNCRTLSRRGVCSALQICMHKKHCRCSLQICKKS
jgi:hypothetical protein